MSSKITAGAVQAGNGVAIDPAGIISALFSSSVLDSTFGTTRGSLIVRGVNGWQLLPPGRHGASLISGGSSADLSWGPNVTTQTVDVKTDFGATGDGVTNDWQAIENARLYLVSLGGGRMYFPPGRYNMPDVGKQLTVTSNIEFFGAGPESVLIGNNAVLIGPNGSHFNVTGYGSYTYYPANTVAAGDRQVTATTHANANNFAAGDIVMICSTGTNVSGLFYYMEINRVLSANGTTGVVTLEDPIDDGWALGLQIAKITTDVAQNYSIHDLTLSCPNGHPNFISASYKSEIRNIWSDGLSVAVMNAFVRSSMHDVIARQNWSGGTRYSTFEIESGSVHANVHDIEVSMYGAGDISGMPLIYTQEFTRRTRVANVRIDARGTAIGDLIQPATAGGHTYENIELNVLSMDTAFRYSAVDDTKSSLNGMPTLCRGVRVNVADGTGNFFNGFVLANVAANGTCQNVTVDNCSISGVNVGTGLVVFAQGIQQNHVFRNVKGPGLIYMNYTGVADPNKPDVGTLTYPLTNVLFDGCEYTQIDSQVMLQNAKFRNCHRMGMPLPKYNASTLVFNSTTANHAELSVSPVAASKFCWGDSFHVKLSAYVDAAHLVNGAEHLAVKAFGIIVTQIDLAQNGPDQMVEIDLTVDLVNNTFKGPNKFVTSGRVAINGVTQNERAGFFFQTFANDGSPIQIQSWMDNAASLITPMMAKISFIPVEARERAGI